MFFKSNLRNLNCIQTFFMTFLSDTRFLESIYPLEIVYPHFIGRTSYKIISLKTGCA